MVEILYTLLAVLLLALLILGALWVTRMILNAAEIQDGNVRRLILALIGLIGLILIALLLIRQAGPAPGRFW